MRWLTVLALCCCAALIKGQGACKLDPIIDMTCSVVCMDLGVAGDVQNPGVAAGDFISSIYPDHLIDCTRWSLKIGNSAFPNGVLSPGWLVGSNLPVIQTVVLHTTSLILIEPAAFDGPIFGVNLRALAIYYNGALNYIDSSITIGLTELNTFEWVGNGRLVRVDQEVFAPFDTTLQVLTIKDCGMDSPDVLANITSYCLTTGKLQYLLVLDLGYNSDGLAMSVLDEGHFNKLPSIMSIYIKNSYVEYMSSTTTFDYIARTLQFLDLSDNMLTHFPNGILDSIIAQNKPRFSLLIQGNPWHCDCRLKWLQDVIKNATGQIALVDEPRCSSPPSEYDKLLVEADMMATCDEVPVTPPFGGSC